jgi:hypothetical protein
MARPEEQVKQRLLVLSITLFWRFDLKGSHMNVMSDDSLQNTHIILAFSFLKDITYTKYELAHLPLREQFSRPGI